MTDDQEPAEPLILEDVGSSGESNKLVAENENAPTNTSLPDKAMPVPSPSSTSVSLGDDEFNKNNLSMAGSFVGEIEQTSDEDVQMNNSSDTGFLSVGQDMEDAAIESEYAEISHNASHLDGMNQPTALVDDDLRNSLHSVDLFDPPGLRPSRPLLAAAKKAKEQADKKERVERAAHLQGMNQPATLVDDDVDSLSSGDLFDPPTTGLRPSRPLLAAAKKAKEQADKNERVERAAHLEGMNQPITLGDDDLRNSLHSVDLFDPPKSGLRESKPLLAAAKKAKEQADTKDRVARAAHLEGMNQPATLVDDDVDSLSSGDLFDPPGPRASRPLLAAAKKAKEQADKKERVERAAHLEGMNQPTTLVDDDLRNSLHSVDLFDPPGQRTSRPLLAAAKKAKEQADKKERVERAAHLQGMNQPATLIDDDVDSLSSGDLFDPPTTGLRPSRPLLAAAKKAKEQADKKEHVERAAHLEGMNQPTTIVEEDDDSLEFDGLFDPPTTGLKASKPLLAAALKAKEQLDQMDRASGAKHLQGMHQPATIVEEDEDSLGSSDLFDPPKSGLRASKPLLAAAIKAKEQRDEAASNHDETQNINNDLSTSKSQEMEKQKDPVELSSNFRPNDAETKSVDIKLDDIIPNSIDKRGENSPNLQTRSEDTENNRDNNENVESHPQETEESLLKNSEDERADGDRDTSQNKPVMNTESTSLVHTGSKDRSSSTANDDSSSWRGVVIGLTVCFLFIIAAQGVTIGILHSGDDDDDVAGTADRGAGTAGATDAPTVAPTLGTGFRSIANESGAIRLDLISDCSEVCTESFAIPAAFDLRWSMSDFISLMSVSSNGDIILECDFSGTCGVIETLGYSLGRGVDTSLQGDIFVLPEMRNDSIGASRQVQSSQTPSLVVSWENLQLSAGFPVEEEFQVNVQVTILEGKIEICYGEGNTHGDFLVASFLNFTEGTSDYPDGYPFSGEGLADRFPSNQCFAFESSDNNNDDEWTLTPTPSSTWFPGDTPYPASASPTNPSFTGFVPLASLEGAIPLTGVSNCDDCYETVPLPTEYLWDGKYPVSSLLVSSNGYLELVGSDGTEYVRINVVAMDLDTSRDNDINVRYFRREPSGVTFVSWENMQVFGASNNDNSRVNGQVLIHPEGRIDICWGEISLDNELLLFESNIYGYVDGSDYYATGSPFDSLGQSNGNSLPSNTCQALIGDSQQTVSVLYGNEFTYLSTVQGATRLETVSSFDDNEQIVELNVPIRWVQDSFTDRLVVTSNGAIRVDGCPLEYAECGEIAVASGDLDPSTNGNVWFLDVARLVEDELALQYPNILYIISWENVSVYSYPLSRINAQALFYEDGTIEICFGAAKAFEAQVLAGVFDPRFNIDEPAWGEGLFFRGGFTEIGVWPTGLCQSFYVATSGSLPIPSMPPASSLSPSPTDVPGFASRCMPTSGACVSTDSDLVTELNEARAGDIVALCGDMKVLRTISVETSNMTLCCVRESSGCFLDGEFETQIMFVSGANVTLSGVKFQNGVSNRNGGNLAIDAPGHHSIKNCSFSGGQTSFMFGGNLHVANSASISISDSRFDIGTAPLGGSGAAFENTWSIDVRNSKFQNNFGQGAGGGVLIYHAMDSPLEDAPVQQLHIENSVFEENSAEIGAGVAVQDVDAINMTVLQSVFAFNVASVVGGALSVTGINSTIATLRGNSGEGNSDAWSTCNDFFFDENMDYENGLCFDTGEMIQLSSDDFLPDETATPSRGPEEVPVCTRTFPTCAETEDDIKSMLLDAEPNDVISLCGGMVSVSETLQVSQLNVTLCCEAYPRCTLSANRFVAPIMSVNQGGNFTAIGLRFQGGVNGDDGGNLLIDAPGYHSILFCEFLGGLSDGYGGNLYIGNAHSVTIAYSHFNSGRAMGGGAVAFVDTKAVSIQGSEIMENSAGNEGGGLFFLSNNETSEMTVLITGTAFEGNGGTEGGGGFAVRGMGSFQVNLFDSWFYDNVASAAGAAGKISVSKVDDFNFEGNFGDFNVDSTNRCEWIFVENGWSELSDLCFNLNLESYISPALALSSSPP